MPGCLECLFRRPGSPIYKVIKFNYCTLTRNRSDDQIIKQAVALPHPHHHATLMTDIQSLYHDAIAHPAHEQAHLTREPILHLLYSNSSRIPDIRGSGYVRMNLLITLGIRKDLATSLQDNRLRTIPYC